VIANDVKRKRYGDIVPMTVGLSVFSSGASVETGSLG